MKDTNQNHRNNQNFGSSEFPSAGKYEQLFKVMRLMCDNVPDFIWAKDIERRYTFVNRGLCEKVLLTKDVNDPVGKTASYFYSTVKEENPDNEEWFTIGDMSDYSDDFVYKFQKPIQVIVSGYVRGEFIEVELNKSPFFDENDNFIGLVGAGRDVTNRRRVERDLRISEERLQLALDGADLGVWDWQIKEDKIFYDPKWVGFYGYTMEEFNNSLDFFKRQIHPEDLPDYEGKMAAHFRNETARFICTFRLRHNQTNQYHWIKFTGAIVERNMQEEPMRMVGVHQDVTEVIEREQILKDAKANAEEGERLKTAFLANLSHEIRTPLNSILGFTKFLVYEEDLSPELRQEYMTIVEESSENFLQVINNIIDMAKIETGTYRVQKGFFDLNQLSKSILKKLERLFKYADKLSLGFTPEPDGELMIYSDKIVFEHIISNLLSNAIKFTHEGEVEFGYELVDETSLFIYVKDSGIGIDIRYEKAIFQPFRQLSESFKREYDGVGLGLSIAYSMTELLDGKMWFESEKGKGTIFYIYIEIVSI